MVDGAVTLTTAAGAGKVAARLSTTCSGVMVLVPRFSTTRRKGTVKVPLPLSVTVPLIRFATASEGAVVTGAESWQSGPTGRVRAGEGQRGAHRGAAGAVGAGLVGQAAAGAGGAGAGEEEGLRQAGGGRRSP